VHFSKKFAQLKGFDDRICHGLLVAGLMTEIGGQIGWLATGMDFRFKRPVYFGDTISCSFTIVEMGEKGWVRAEYTYTNQDKVVVLDGVITGFLPGPEEKEVMKRLVSEADPTDKN
jgi:acyl dehydratase